MASWPKRIAVGYSCLIIIFAVGHFAGIYDPEPGIDDRYFGPYLWISGPIVFILAEITTIYVRVFMYKLFGYRFISSTAVIVIIPGIFNILFGSIQWYYLAKLGIALREFFKKSSTSEKKNSI